MMAKNTLLAFLAVGILIWLPGFAVSASEAETVISQCQERTGMGRESCISFIKKYMNVERCQQYTDYSAEECQKKLEEIRKSPEFNSAAVPPAVETPKPTTSPVQQPPLSFQGKTVSLKEKIQLIRQDKAARFTLIEEEIVRLLRFLEEHGYNTDQLEEKLALFQLKRDVALKGYDQYATLADVPAPERPSLEAPRRVVAQLLHEAADYYRNDLLPAVAAAVATLPE